VLGVLEKFFVGKLGFWMAITSSTLVAFGKMNRVP